MIVDPTSGLEKSTRRSSIVRWKGEVDADTSESISDSEISCTSCLSMFLCFVRKLRRKCLVFLSLVLRIDDWSVLFDFCFFRS